VLSGFWEFLVTRNADAVRGGFIVHKGNLRPFLAVPICIMLFIVFGAIVRASMGLLHSSHSPGPLLLWFAGALVAGSPIIISVTTVGPMVTPLQGTSGLMDRRRTPAHVMISDAKDTGPYAGTNFPLLTSMMVSSAPNRAQDFAAYSLASLRGCGTHLAGCTDPSTDSRSVVKLRTLQPDSPVVGLVRLVLWPMALRPPLR
jgi:hypothetical protein